MNNSSANILRNKGVTIEIVTVYGAIDSDTFRPLDSTTEIKPFVLITSQAAERKRPELILEFIQDSPGISFVIHGKSWESYDTKELSNLEVRSFDYSRQPILMREASTFLSISWVEGGPFPILEALASGTPVVSTITGFAPDLINKRNGRLIENPYDFSSLREHIRDCLRLKMQVASNNLLPLDLSWKTLSQHFYE